jgi:threonine/homoserine/homoserine lactone efflux protein
MTELMLLYLAVFSSSFAVALSGAMMPGPLLTAAISESLRRGFIAGPLLIAGHGLLEMALLLALLLGLSPLFNQPWFFIAVSLAGGAILLWMAWSVMRALPDLNYLEDGGGEKGDNLVLKGVVVSISNPYFTIWWATIGLGCIIYSLRLGAAGIIAFFSGHILADFLWYGAVSLALARGKRFLSPRLYKGIMAVSALLLALFACYFIYSGLGRLMA